MLKKFLPILIALAIPSIAFGATASGWFFNSPTDGYISPTKVNGVLQGIATFASSTIGNATQTDGLTINGGATTTGTAYFSTNIGINNPSPTSAQRIAITGAAADTAVIVTGLTSGIGLSANTLTSGTAVSATGINTGTGLSVTAITNGKAVNCNYGATSATGSCILSNSSVNTTADYTGSGLVINATPTRNNAAAATRTHSGNIVNITPTYATSGAVNAIQNITGTTTILSRILSNTATGVSSAVNATAPVVEISNKTGSTTGVTDSSNLLSLLQIATSSTGTVLSLNNAGSGNLATFMGNGNFGIGTSSPWRTLSVGNGNVGSFGISTTTSGCAQFSPNGELYATGTNCGTGGASSYDFPLAGNATSTLTGFNGGLTAYASSTIGDGSQGGGFTVNGGSTTTLNAYFANSVGIGTNTIGNKLTIKSASVSSFPVAVNASANGTGFMTVQEKSNGSMILNLGDQTGTTADQFQSSGPSYFNGGSLGIGTTTPQFNLTSAVASGVSGCAIGFNRATSVGGCVGGQNGAFSTVSSTFFEWYTGGTEYAPGTTNSEMVLRNHVLSVGTTTATTGGHLNIWGRNNAAAYFEVTNADAGDTTPNGDVFIINSAGNVGVGTTSPMAKLSVYANNGDTNTNVFNIGSSTASSISSLFNVDNQGTTTIAGQLFTSMGSAAAPAYSFTGNAGYGTSLSGTALQFSTAGVARFDINANFLFSAQSGTGPSMANATGASLTAPDFIPDRGDTTTGFAAGVLGNINTIIGGAETSRWTSIGYGIGTSTPYSKLSVWGGDTSANTRAFEVTNSASTTLLSLQNNGELVGTDATNNFTGRISPTHSFALTTGTTTTWTASTTGTAYSPFVLAPYSGTLKQAYCATDASFLGVNVQVNGSNATPSYFVASTTVGNVLFTAGNTFTKGQKLLMNVGTTTTASTQSITCNFDVTETP